jgi:DNA-binding NarL/FixJ family response regulator
MTAGRRRGRRRLRNGASGFLLKDAPPEDLVRAIRVVAAGDALLAPSVTRRLIEDVSRTRARPVVPPRRRCVAAVSSWGMTSDRREW